MGGGGGIMGGISFLFVAQQCVGLAPAMLTVTAVRIASG